MSHWFVLFLSSRQSCRCPMDARRSSNVEVPTESLVPYSWRKMLAPSQMKVVRCQSWTFINVRVCGLSGSSGLSVFSGLVAGFRIPFVSGLVAGFRVQLASAAVHLVRYRITTVNKEFTQFVSSISRSRETSEPFQDFHPGFPLNPTMGTWTW